MLIINYLFNSENFFEQKNLQCTQKLAFFIAFQVKIFTGRLLEPFLKKICSEQTIFGFSQRLNVKDEDFQFYLGEIWEEFGFKEIGPVGEVAEAL